MSLLLNPIQCDSNYSCLICDHFAFLIQLVICGKQFNFVLLRCCILTATASLWHGTFDVTCTFQLEFHRKINYKLLNKQLSATEYLVAYE